MILLEWLEVCEFLVPAAGGSVIGATFSTAVFVGRLTKTKRYVCCVFRSFVFVFVMIFLERFLRNRQNFQFETKPVSRTL